MDARQLELLMRKKSDIARIFLEKIEKFYVAKKESVNLQEIVRVPGIMLYFQNRAFVKEFFEMSRLAELSKELDIEKKKEINARFVGFIELINAIDTSLKEINPTNNPIDEMFLICALMRMGINTMIKMNPYIGG